MNDLGIVKGDYDESAFHCQQRSCTISSRLFQYALIGGGGGGRFSEFTGEANGYGRTGH